MISNNIGVEKIKEQAGKMINNPEVKQHLLLHTILAVSKYLSQAYRFQDDKDEYYYRKTILDYYKAYTHLFKYEKDEKVYCSWINKYSSYLMRYYLDIKDINENEEKANKDKINNKHYRDEALKYKHT